MDKIREYITPYADILAWCLMPNHFHLMILINHTELDRSPEKKIGPDTKKRSLNNSIAIVLRSYTNFINKEQNRTGSLFRQKTKSVCLDPENGVMPSWYIINGVSKINIQYPEIQYPQVCFNYIHYNPLVSGLVKKISAWEFSSAPELLGITNYGLVNKERVDEIGLKMQCTNRSDEPIR